jgi:hypothetical protein
MRQQVSNFLAKFEMRRQVSSISAMLELWQVSSI